MRFFCSDSFLLLIHFFDSVQHRTFHFGLGVRDAANEPFFRCRGLDMASVMVGGSLDV
jgi:hypothetical protein